MKTEVYNLIVLDESGSMSSVRYQTISGCNETINTIKNAQIEFADTQDHKISIFAFQSGGAPSRYIIKNLPAAETKLITSEDYQPNGCTPLYDALGYTLTSLDALVKERENAIGSVTIITDGYENSSEHFTHNQIAKLISALKEKGWNFSFIGANIDVEATAQRLNIDNYLEFKHDAHGVKAMFDRESMARISFCREIDNANEEMSEMQFDSDEELRAERISRMKQASRNYFNKK